MAERDQADILRPSILDRLIGEGADGQRGLRPYMGFRELREAVGRDLEWLLNSKRFPLELDDYDEAKASNLGYGVPDFATYSWSNHADARRIANAIEEAIERFEPRLAPGTIKVSIQPAGEVDDFRIRLRIDALLQVDPVSEPVSFDTAIDMNTTTFEVTGSS